jgi:4-aminobutyrate aminotransferase-like enzyme
MASTGAMPNSFDASALSEVSQREQMLIARRRRLLGPGYKLFYRRPIEIVRAKGVHVYDRDGTEYLDAYNNVPCVGHSDPTVTAAVADRMAALNTNTRYLDEPILEYAERLLATHHGGLDTVMFACTGSEATDLALRIARHATGRTGVVVSANAYHGLTSAAAEISPSLGPREPLGAHVRTVAPPSPGEDAEQAGPAFARRVSRAIDDLRRHGIDTAAVVLDSIFASDGVRPDPRGFLAPVVDAVRAQGALFVADEVQAGFARTGEAMWGYQRHGIAPDLVTMGKPMGNGVPIAGVAARAELIERFGSDIRYFNTFGGNSVAIAAATAVLDVLERDALMANARAVGGHLLRGLARLDARSAVLRDVRGAGLYIAADCTAPDTDDHDPDVAGRVVNGLRDRHVLISATGPTGATLKIRPPLPFSEGDADRLLTALADVLGDLGDG